MPDGPLPRPLRWLVRGSVSLLPAEVRHEVAEDLRDVFRCARARGDGLVRASLEILWFVVTTDYLALHRSARRLRSLRTPSETGALRVVGSGGRGAGPWGFALKHPLRSVLRSPGFSVLAVGTIAVGVGSVAAVSGVVSTVLLHPLPYRDAGELVMVWQRDPDTGERINVSEPQFREWTARSASFSRLAAYRGPGWTMVTDGPEPERVPSVRVTPSFFATLGVAPELGRGFTADAGHAGAACEAIVSRPLWARLGRDDDAIGSTASLDEEPCVIVGVMPAGFWFVERGVDVWYPYQADAPETWDQWTLKVVARLAPGATASSADRELSERHAALRAARPDLDVPPGVTVRPLMDEIVGGVRGGLLATAAAVGLALLIATVNVGGLLLARNLGRRPEFAMMRALGASRGTVLAHVAIQGLALSGAGLALGWGVAHLLVGVVVRLLPPDFPRADELGLDGSALVAAGAAAFIVALGSGWLSLPPNDAALGSGMRPARDHKRALGGILVAQTAIAVVLLVAGGLLVRSFVGLSGTDPGIRPDGAVALELRLPPSAAASDDAVRQFVARVDDAVAALPGVTAAGQVQRLPFAGGNWSSFVLDPERPREGAPPDADVRVVTPGYFAAIGLPLVSGRSFGRMDAPYGARSVLVNRLLADRLWPGEDPVGRRLVVDMFDDWDAEVVGVVGPVRHHGLATEPRPEVYVPYAQAPVAFSTLVVRGAGVERLVDAVRRTIHDIAPTATVSRATTMTALVERSIAIPRMHAFVFGSLALLALLLSAVGVFAVASFRVSHGTREIGLRAALGASSGTLWAEVVRDAARLLGAGLALGLLAALALTRGLAALLYGLGPADFVTYVEVVLTLGVLGLGATLLPARRAARVDPMVAMRDTG